MVASLAVASRELGLRDLRRFAIARSLFRATDLAAAIERLGFVQADPIRAPARAQDLILRPRVADYRAGDLERRYGSLEIEEDFYVNYGFVPRALDALMHPRKPRRPWSSDLLGVTAGRCSKTPWRTTIPSGQSGQHGPRAVLLAPRPRNHHRPHREADDKALRPIRCDIRASRPPVVRVSDRLGLPHRTDVVSPREPSPAQKSAAPGVPAGGRSRP